MFIKEVEYEDVFTGEMRTKELLFNLTKKELMEFASHQHVDDLQAYIEKITDEQDKEKMFNMFNELVLRAYGERTEAGGFVKKDRTGTPLSIEFEASNAYSVFLMQMLEDPTGNGVIEFITKVIPADMMAQANEAIKSGQIPQIAQSSQN